MERVLDEWLWADLGGDNGEDRRRESFRFLAAVFARCDRIVIPTGTEFADKFWKLCSKAAPGDRRRQLVKYFRQCFELNSAKTEKLHLRTNTPEQLQSVANVKPDDRYLVLTYWQSQADWLVTTDQALLGAPRELGIRTAYRDDFLREYLSGA